MPGQEDAVGYAYAVEMDARWLLRKLANPEADADITYAAETLGNTAERILADGGVRRFAPAPGEPAPGEPAPGEPAPGALAAVEPAPGAPAAGEPVARPDELDVLGTAVAELNVAATVLAASRATAFGAGSAERVDFERAVADLGACRHDLERDRDQAAKAFAPVIEHSPDPVTAAERLRDEAVRTLDAMAARASDAIRKAFSTAAGCTPGQLGAAVSGLRDLGALGAGLHAVKAKLQGLARLALRLMEDAFTRMSRFLPTRCADEARARVRRLADTAGSANPGGVTAEVLDILAAKQEIADRFATADPERWDTKLLDRGTAELGVLRDRFEKTMAAMDVTLKVAAVIGDVLALIPVAMEFRPAVLASVAVTVIAFVVMIGRDYVDSGSVLGVVHGVRHVVAVACGGDA